MMLPDDEMGFASSRGAMNMVVSISKNEADCQLTCQNLLSQTTANKVLNDQVE
jgi:hypothetical protein